MSGESLESLTLGRTISVAELVALFWRERLLLLAATSLAMVVGAIATWWMPKVYAGDALIDIGELKVESAQYAIDRTMLTAGRVVTATYRAPGAYYLSAEADSPAEVQSRLERFASQAINELHRVLEDSAIQARSSMVALERQRVINAEQARVWILQVRDDLQHRIEGNSIARRNVASERLMFENERRVLFSRVRTEFAIRLRTAQQATARYTKLLKQLTAERAAAGAREAELRQDIERLRAEFESVESGNLNGPIASLFTMQLRRETSEAQAELRAIQADLLTHLPSRIDEVNEAVTATEQQAATIEAASKSLAATEGRAGKLDEVAAKLLSAQVEIADVANLTGALFAQEQILDRREEDLRGEAQQLDRLKRQLAAVDSNISKVAAVALDLSRLGVAVQSAGRADWALTLDRTTADLDTQFEGLAARLQRARQPQIISGPEVLAQPVRPKLSWNLALSATLGLSVAALFALMWRGTAARERPSA